MFIAWYTYTQFLHALSLSLRHKIHQHSSSFYVFMLVIVAGYKFLHFFFNSKQILFNWIFLHHAHSEIALCIKERIIWASKRLILRFDWTAMQQDEKIPSCSIFLFILFFKALICNSKKNVERSREERGTQYIGKLKNKCAHAFILIFMCVCVFFYIESFL